MKIVVSYVVGDLLVEVVVCGVVGCIVDEFVEEFDEIF